MRPSKTAPRGVLLPWLAEPGQNLGVGDTARARVTWGQGLPSSLEAHPVLEVPAHRHLAIPAWWQSTRRVPWLVGTGQPGAPSHPEWLHRAGEHPTPLGPGDTYLLPFGSSGPLGSLRRHQAMRKGWVVGAQPTDSICCRHHLPPSSPCASYSHLPQDPPAPQIFLAPPGRGEEAKSRVGR